MKRKTLTSAVLAGVAGVAGITSISSAVNLNPDGLGEVLIYPYYTVENGNDTLVSVVNTTDQVKAVKVRFLESRNSLETLDFNLYLSPFDVWVGAVTREPGAEDGAAVVTTNDVSCTVPTFFGNQDGTFDNGLPYVRFRTLLFGNDKGGTSVTRTREGYVEMIEMGELDPTTSIGRLAVHTSTGLPRDCGTLNALWAPGGLFSLTPGLAITEPDGGLFGGGTIINVGNGYAASYNADAIAGFYDPEGPGAASTLDLHSQPGDTFPDLTQAQTALVGDVTSNVFDNARVVTSSWTDGIDAVSAVFMRDAVFNEYAIDTGLNGATEWVLTFPTKRFYVNPGINAPFTSSFGSNGACEDIGINFWDREERTTVGGVNFSPSVSPVPNICFEAQVITFGQGGTVSDILGSDDALNIAVDSAGFENGWARITLDVDGQGFTSNDMDSYAGLPVTGFSMVVVQNGTLTDADGNSILSNYAGMFDHRYSRDIVGS